MGRVRFKELGIGSFFGSYVFERAVPEGHFLRQLDKLVDWEEIRDRLLPLYLGGATAGRPPYDPVVMFKTELLAYLYNLSERQVEQFVNDSLSAKWFLGLAVDKRGPDHTSLTKFKNRIKKNGGEELLDDLLVTVVRMASEQGLELGEIQVVDSTHTLADVNVTKDDQRRKEGKARRDRGARWGAKGKRRKRGMKKARPWYFYGYKAHMSMNAKAELITSVSVTPGNAHDGKQFPDLVEKDVQQGLPVSIYSADRGYDDGENHYLLEISDLHSAIILNRYRTEKKDKNKQKWIDLRNSPEYKAGKRERYKIERKFGEAKQNHGLARCRHVGREGYMIQAYMTAIALNLKRMVKVVTGASPRGGATVMA